MNGNRPETLVITGLLIYLSNGLAIDGVLMDSEEANWTKPIPASLWEYEVGQQFPFG
jgi:hypothetical protein